MKKYILDGMMNLINSNDTCLTNFEIEKIRYGLEGIYLSITKLIFLSVVTIYCGIFKEFLIFTLLYNLIRMFAFGIHASKSYICWIFSSVIFVCLPYLAIIVKINIYFKFILSLFCLIMIILYAPADTHKRPLIKKKRRLKFKFYSIVIAIIYVCFILISINQYLSNASLFALLTETALILPITYKIFKMPYKNYQTYQRKVTN